MAKSGGALILYDGLCGLCNGWVRFVLDRDRNRSFTFAPIQGATARKALGRQTQTQVGNKTIILVVFAGRGRPSIFVKSSAVFEILSRLEKPWPVVGLLRHLPRLLTDGVYSLVAAVRRPLFRRYDSCPAPPPGTKGRFMP